MGNKVSQLDNFSGPCYRWQDPHIVRMVGDRLKKEQSGLTLPVDLKQKKKKIEYLKYGLCTKTVRLIDQDDNYFLRLSFVHYKSNV